jgi:hypothetical protein
LAGASEPVQTVPEAQADALKEDFDDDWFFRGGA